MNSWMHIINNLFKLFFHYAEPVASPDPKGLADLSPGELIGRLKVEVYRGKVVNEDIGVRPTKLTDLFL